MSCQRQAGCPAARCPPLPGAGSGNVAVKSLTATVFIASTSVAAAASACSATIRGSAFPSDQTARSRRCGRFEASKSLTGRTCTCAARAWAAADGQSRFVCAAGLRVPWEPSAAVGRGYWPSASTPPLLSTQWRYVDKRSPLP